MNYVLKHHFHLQYISVFYRNFLSNETNFDFLMSFWTETIFSVNSSKLFSVLWKCISTKNYYQILVTLILKSACVEEINTSYFTVPIAFKGKYFLHWHLVKFYTLYFQPKLLYGSNTLYLQKAVNLPNHYTLNYQSFQHTCTSHSILFWKIFCHYF